jgi:hypothetical protein
VTKFLLAALAAAALAAAAAGAAAALYRKRAKKAEADAEDLRKLYWEMAARAEKLRTAAEKNAEAEEAAHEERAKLSETPDGSLAGRANSLFGVQKPQSGG